MTIVPAQPRWALKLPTQPETPDPSTVADDEVTPRARRLKCRTCGNEVADERDIITVRGTQAHVFANPAGVVFELLTVAVAGGVFPIGAPSSEFSWFPPHAWQVVLCTRCATHLGWKFMVRSSSFFGLIRPRLHVG